MSTQTADLYLLEDLEGNGRISDLAARDRDALRAVADTRITDSGQVAFPRLSRGG